MQIFLASVSFVAIQANNFSSEEQLSASSPIRTEAGLTVILGAVKGVAKVAIGTMFAV